MESKTDQYKPKPDEQFNTETGEITPIKNVSEELRKHTLYLTEQTYPIFLHDGTYIGYIHRTALNLDLVIRD